MKKALVSTDGRIAEVADAIFPVHPSLVWVDVPDDTVAGDSYINGVVVKRPLPVLDDMSDNQNLPKVLKAIVLAAAAMSGKTPLQAKAAFKAAFDSLP